MTDSSDYIGELEMKKISADERAAWADHFRAMGWAPPEEMEELRRLLRECRKRFVEYDMDVAGEVDEAPAHHRRFMRELDAAIDAEQKQNTD